MSELISLVTPLPPVAAEDRDAARRAWEESRSAPAEQWVLAEQRRLAEQGWTGRVIDVPQTHSNVVHFPRLGEWNQVEGTTPPELAALHAQAVAKSAVVGTMTPGEGKDAAWLAMEAGARESRERAATDAIRLEQRMAGWGIYFGAPEPSE